MAETGMETAVDPIALFGAWMREAEASELNDASAGALAFQSAAGTDDKVTFFPYFWLSSGSQTQVLISYTLG